MAEKLTSLLVYADEILKQIEQQNSVMKEIIEQLNKVEQPYQNILFKMYIQGKTLVRVADEMSYEYKYICKQHGIALNKFDEHDKKGVMTTHNVVL